MKRMTVSAVTFLLALLVLTPAARAAAASYTFTTIGYPDPTDQYIDGRGINDSGTVCGYYADSSGNHHGFVRSADGSKFTKFDVQLTGVKVTYTRAYGINNNDDVVGTNVDSVGAHGFVRSVNGSKVTYTPVDVTLLGAEAGQTYAYGINDKGDIAGYYEDSTTN
ncbi:MAG: hypothetical protein ABSG91_14885 [Syntrophobacteraceae bacterium]|jgi:hypothetical protein